MSWFTELAGKAESLLEKVDTAAASALTKEQVNQEPGGFTAAGPATVNSEPTQRITPVPFNNQGVDSSRTSSESSVLGGKNFLLQSTPDHLNLLLKLIKVQVIGSSSYQGLRTNNWK